MKPQYPKIFKAFPLPALLLLPDAPCFTIADVNSAYLKITGKKEAELPGKSIFITLLNAPEDLTSDAVVDLRQSLLTVFSTGKPHTMSIQEYHKPGIDKFTNRRSFENIPINNSKGKATIIIHSVPGATQDITKRKELENLLDKATRLARIGNCEVDLIKEKIYWYGQLKNEMNQL